MEKEIEKDTFDINTIGLYDVEKDRKWKERSKMEYAEKIGYQKGYQEGFQEEYQKGYQEGFQEEYQKGYQEGFQEEYQKGYEEGRKLGRREAISKMLNYDLTLEEISRMINISLEDIKRMSQL